MIILKKLLQPFAGDIVAVREGRSWSVYNRGRRVFGRGYNYLLLADGLSRGAVLKLKKELEGV